jgi:alkanesulfonate monooxygenase SsuD/methylene tetrahydromethanopterin reductase-like flavin-dependent oxidoreductase (luciferase family)
MIGGGGEQKTLRLVAQYADATNVFGDGPRLAHKFAVLREHCERLGRPYEEIERSTLQTVSVSLDGAGSTSTPAQLIDQFGELSDAGVQHVIIGVRGVQDIRQLELLGQAVIPQIRSL